MKNCEIVPKGDARSPLIRISPNKKLLATIFSQRDVDVYDISKEEGRHVFGCQGEPYNMSEQYTALTNSAFIYSTPSETVAVLLFETGREEGREDKRQEEGEKDKNKVLLWDRSCKVVQNNNFLVLVDFCGGVLRVFLSESLELVRTIRYDDVGAEAPFPELSFTNEGRLAILEISTLLAGTIIKDVLNPTSLEVETSQYTFSVATSTCAGKSISNMSIHAPKFLRRGGFGVEVYSQRTRKKRFMLNKRKEDGRVISWWLGSNYGAIFAPPAICLFDLRLEANNCVARLFCNGNKASVLLVKPDWDLLVAKNKRNNIEVRSFLDSKKLFEFAAAFAKILPPYVILLLYDTLQSLEYGCSLRCAERWQHRKKIFFIAKACSFFGNK